MAKRHPSKKAKRKAEFLEREKKREIDRNRRRMIEEAVTMEDMAKAMGIPLR